MGDAAAGGAERTLTAMPSPYAPLAAYLADQPASTPTVTLTLAAIEQVIGQSLPAGASTQMWWTARRGWDRQPRPWVAAGWRVAGVVMRMATPSVTFARVTAAPAEHRAAPGSGGG
jgi:hypothetical protein